MIHRRESPTGERQYLGQDGFWYAEGPGTQVASPEPVVAAPVAPVVAKATPNVPPTPARIPPPVVNQSPIVKRWTLKVHIARVLLVGWVVLVIVAFVAGGVGWGIFTIALSLGLLIGIAKAKGDDANRISKVAGQGPTGASMSKVWRVAVFGEEVGREEDGPRSACTQNTGSMRHLRGSVHTEADPS